MSVYYFLVCDRHKEWCNAASSQAGGSGHLIDSDETLPDFVVAHHGCTLKSVSEFDDDARPMEYIQWSRNNRESLNRRRRA